MESDLDKIKIHSSSQMGNYLTLIYKLKYFDSGSGEFAKNKLLLDFIEFELILNYKPF